MTVDVIEEPTVSLIDYGRVPIAFEVKSRFRIEPIQSGLGGLLLIEEPVVPYVKDYDAMPGEAPSNWVKIGDISHWGVLGAFQGKQRVGGAVLAWKTDGLSLLERREDIAALWDIRVHPNYRNTGVGCHLFTRALAWACERQCQRLVVETQNINVPACRFYARQGCILESINQQAYGNALDEVQLLWYRRL